MTSSVVEAFRQQVRWCTQMGSPFTAGLLACAADQIERGGTLAKRLRDWPGDPMADLVALRLAGAVHAIVLSGEAPELAAGFPPHARQFDAARLWPLTYLDDALQARIRDLIERTGASRTDAAPLAWLRLEHTEASAPPRLLMDAWPNGRQEVLAEADAHGSWVRWRG